MLFWTLALVTVQACITSDLTEHGCKCIAFESSNIQLHTGLSGDTISVCVVSVKGNWVGTGMGSDMNENGHVIVSSDEGQGVSKSLKLTAGKIPDNPNSKLQARDIANPKQGTLCYKFPAGNVNIRKAKWACAAGKNGRLARHEEAVALIMDFEAGVATTRVTVLHVVHFFCMSFAFIVLFPAGMVVAAYAAPGFAGGKKYFAHHRQFMMTACALTLFGVGAILYKNVPDNAHGIAGLVIVFFAFLQPINGVLRPDKGTKHRRKWEIAHKASGRIAVVGGLIVSILGSWILYNKFQIKFVFFLFVFIAFVVCGLVLYFLFWMKKKESREQKSSKESNDHKRKKLPSKGGGSPSKGGGKGRDLSPRSLMKKTDESGSLSPIRLPKIRPNGKSELDLDLSPSIRGSKMTPKINGRE